MFKVLIYRGTTNLGDAIQTLALCRLLGCECTGIYRDEEFPPTLDGLPLVVNGWLGYGTAPKPRENCVFAGVHLGMNEGHYLEWLARTDGIVGVRDPYTKVLLRKSGIQAMMIGCATLTLPRYDGLRQGRLSVDVGPLPGTEYLTNRIDALDWSAQWRLAVDRLQQLRQAEVVYTNRLHVILPCLAFGTPVVCPSQDFDGIRSKNRFTLLTSLGFRCDREVTTDVAGMAQGYRHFLERALCRSLTPVDQAIMPTEAPIKCGVSQHATEIQAPHPMSAGSLPCQ